MVAISTYTRRTIAAVRFGYGLSPTLRAPRDADDLMEELRRGATARMMFEAPDLGHRARQLRARQEAVKAARGGPKQKKFDKLFSRLLRQDVSDILTQRAFGQGMFERMSAFWADHFSISTKSSVANPLAPAYEPMAIRPHVMGRFDDMLVAVSRNPLMIEYLDQRLSFGPNSKQGRNRKKGLNENLAREVLELHTMGVDGSYTQQDVREFAKLLTGHSWDRKSADFKFIKQRAEPGKKHILGKTYGQRRARVGDAEAFLRDVARHPDTIAHVTRKLAVHFISDRPDPDLLAHLGEAWRRSDGDLPQVYAALLDHPASWQAPGAKVKRPIEFMAAAARAMNVRMDKAPLKQQSRLINALQRMNQLTWRAPGPDGWAEEPGVWINAPGLTVRLEVASRFGTHLAKARDLDPRVMAEKVLGSDLKPATAFAVGAAEERWEGFALIFASAEFNRR